MAKTKDFLRVWWPERPEEKHQHPKDPQTPDRAVVKLYDATGREMEIRRPIGFRRR
jgi:hypothetical protein